MNFVAFPRGIRTMLAVLAMHCSLTNCCQAEGDVPSMDWAGKLFPAPGTKRIYLQQPCDEKIVEARPDLKILMKNATQGGYVTGLGFVILQDNRPESFDFTKTRQTFEDCAYPMLKQRVAQRGFVFEQTSFTTADADGRPLLMIRMRIAPESEDSPRSLTLGWLSSRQPHHRYYSHGNEDYIVFEPWGPAWETPLGLRCDNGVLHDGQTVFAALRVSPNVAVGSTAEGPKAISLTISLEQASDAVIDIAVPYEGIAKPVDAHDTGWVWQAKKAFSLAESPHLQSLSFDEAYARQVERWSQYENRAAKILTPEPVVQQVYRTLTLNSLQFLGASPDVSYYKPGQGGFNNFSVVYGWESANFLAVLDRQGFQEEIRRVLDYFLTTQQGTHGPEGDISTAEGCFRPHIHWMCETGAILGIFAEHALCAGGADELRRDSAALIKAARWIQGQRARTKQTDANGKKVPYFGLMPRGRATDWPDAGYAFFTDAYTWKGLDRLASAYEAAQLPDAKWLREEADDYHRCILDAVTKSVKPHPLDPSLQWVPDEVFEDPVKALPTTIFAGPQGLLGAGVLASDSPLVPAIEASLRKANCMNDLFGFHMKTMEDETLKKHQEASAGGKVDLYYVGNCERIWHRIWLERGERIKALRYFYMTLACATSRDVHLAHERYCPQLPWLLPWQPNASGSGRILDMIFNAFIFEKKDSLCLCYGVPDAWFASGQPLGVDGLHTLFGKISFRLTPDKTPGTYQFSYTCDGAGPSQFLLAIPTGKGTEARRIVTIPSEGRKSATLVLP